MELIVWIAALSLPFSFGLIGYFRQKLARDRRRAGIAEEDRIMAEHGIAYIEPTFGELIHPDSVVETPWNDRYQEVG